MRDPLPESIDPRRYLGNHNRLSGIWPAARCRRVLTVAERLLSDVTLEIRLIADGQYVKLDGRISVELELCCQRCLRNMAWKLDESLKLLLVPKGAVVADQVDYEQLELDEYSRLDTGKWIEDEIILRIPSAPVHDRRRNCDPDILERAHEFDSHAVDGVSAKDNPFKVLKGWKGNERG